MSVTELVDNSVELEAIDLDIKGVNDSITSFEKIITSKFSNEGMGSNHIIFSGIIDNENISDVVRNCIEKSNYDINLLQKENIILFDSPIFISTLRCITYDKRINDFKKQSIKIISSEGIDKKYITDSNYEQNYNNIFSEYIVNEVSYGVIFTSILELYSFKFLNILDFISDDNNLNSMMDAYQNLSTSLLDFNKLANDRHYFLSKKISDSENKYNLINKDVQLLLNEQERLINSNSKNSNMSRRIQSDIDKASEELKVVNIDFFEKNQLVVEEELKLHQLKKDVKSASEYIRIYKNELESTQESLRKAKKDSNLISFDMEGFNSESKKQLRYYYFLAFSVIVFLATVFSFMYRNAQTFETIASQENKLSLLEILLSRLPLITATALVIGTLSALLFYLINHIMVVNLDKMNMLKASILAEQITGSLPENNMSDDKIREFQRNIKIELVMNVFSKETVKLKKKDHSELIEKVVDAMASKK